MSDVAASTRNVLSFDVEDWFHLLDDDLGARPERWPALPTIVPRAIDTMLAIADDAGVRATFFVLGWVAARYPGSLRRFKPRDTRSRPILTGIGP